MSLAPLDLVTEAARRLAAHPAASLASVTSLAVALAVAVLIGQYVYHEATFDTFHDNADRIRRLVVTDGQAGTTSARLPAFVGTSVAEAVPGVEAVVLVRPAHAEVLIEGEQAGQPSRVYREDVLYADSEFFHVFSFALLAGSPQAFGAQGTAVLTEDVARAVFGTADVVGEMIRVNAGEPVEVVAVAATPPTRTTIPFGVVVSMATFQAVQESRGFSLERNGWNEFAYHTYALLSAPGLAAEELAAASERVVTDRAGGKAIADRQITFEPVQAARHRSAAADGLVPPGQTAYLVVLLGIAALLLGVAGATVTNLTVARSLRNAHEIGVRQALGATPRNVAAAYIAEAFVLSVSALVVGLALARLALPAFQSAVGVPVEMRYESAWVWAGLAALVLAAGLAVGLYPAAALSRLSPDAALRGRAALTGAWLRRGLVSFQFAATVFLMACAAVLALQLSYLRAAPIGFERSDVAVIPLRQSEAIQNADVLLQEIAALPQVSTVSAATSVPAFFGDPSNSVVALDDPDREQVLMYVEGADAEYAEALGLTLVAGRFLRDAAADSGRAAVINETAAQALGWTEPVGKQLQYWGGNDRTVVGVVRDFHVASPRTPVAPALFVSRAELWASVVAVKTRPGSTGTIEAIRATWERLYPDDPFQAHDLETAFNRLTADEARLATAFAWFAAVAVLIACLGLASLVAFAAERKRREIGVRVALGATEWDIARLLGQEFAPLLVVGFVVALPVAAWATRVWLEGFALQVPLGPGPFAMAGLAAAALAAGVVLWRGLQAARLNPADALRPD